MRYYPAFLDLAAKRCLVAGAGSVGRRKAATILACSPASVLLVDPGPAHPELDELLANPVLSFENRPFQDQDLSGVFLAVAATADSAVNERIALLCREKSILCNVIDAPDLGDFIVPSSMDLGDLVVALSTSGQSPALTRLLRQDLQEYLGSRYTKLLAFMGRLRPMVLAQEAGSVDHAALFRSLADSGLARMMAEDDAAGTRELLARLLPPQLRTRMEELLHGLV